MTDNDTRKKSKHPFLKKLLIIFIITYIIFYIISATTMSNLSSNTKDIFLSTNNSLIDQGMSIDHITTSPYGDGNNIFDVKINNPAGFSNQALLYTPEIRLNSAYSTNPKAPYIAITSAQIKKAVINYEINAKQEINFHKTLDNIISKLLPNVNSSSLTNPEQPLPPLNYSGAKFFLGNVIFEKPIINVYINGKLTQKFTTDDLVLKFKTSPLTYGDALLTGSTQFVTKLDTIVKR